MSATPIPGAPRVTKVVCPCCEGDPEETVLGCCMWCGNTGGRIPVDKALRYADGVYSFSYGAYIEGGTLQELREEEAKAERIYRVCGYTPPWKEKQAA